MTTTTTTTTTTSTIVRYIKKNGRKVRICLHCQLLCDEQGNPDPTYYSPAMMEYFATIPIEDRCNHTKEKKICFACGRDL